MTKSEIVKKLAELYKDYPADLIDSFVNKAFHLIREALANNQRVELRGFGAFSVRKRLSRAGRNPRTGEKVQVAAKKVPHFKLGRPLLEELNNETLSSKSVSSKKATS